MKTAKRQAAEIKRLKTLADSMRGQTQKRARSAQDARHTRAPHRSVRGSPRRSDAGGSTSAFPAPPRSGRTVLTATELWKAFGALDVFSDVSFDVGRGERLLVMGLNGAGKTTLLKVLAGRLEPDLGEVALGTNVSLGYYAQEHEGIRAGRTLLDHMREASDLGDGELRSAARDVRADGTEGVPGRRHAVGRREDEARARCSSSPAATTCCCSTSRPTTSIPRRVAATGAALAAWPGTMIVVSHDVEFVRALAPDRALLMPEGTLDYFDDSMLEYVELA